MSTIVMPLSFTKPPLTANMRFDHWAPKAKLVKQIRTEVYLRARSMKLPQGLDHITVGLHYQPRDNRRRDEDNLVPTLKAACDALAAGTVKHPGYGVVADDTPAEMRKLMPVIHPPVKGESGKMWLEISAETF